MKLRNLFLTAVAGILAFCGCDLFENDKPMLGITVEPDQVEIARMGGGTSIEIKTDQAWTITVPREADWLLVDPLSGGGSQYVNLYAEANNGKVRHGSRYRNPAGRHRFRRRSHHGNRIHRQRG